MSKLTPSQIAAVKMQDKAYRDGFHDLSAAVYGAMDELRKQGYTQIELGAVDRIVKACVDKLGSQDVDQMIALHTVSGTPQ